MLHDLKEAPVIRTVDPFTGADLCKHRVAEHRDGGQSFNSIHPLLRQTAGLNLHHSGILPANLYLLTPSAPFTFMGCGLHCRKALLPRGRKTAPDDKFSDTAPVPVRHFNRAKRESDARSPLDLHQKTQLRQPTAGF